MAQRSRTRAILAGSIAFVAVPAFLGSTPAQAQFIGSNLREANAIAQLLADAETARLDGNCAQRDAKLTEAQTRIAGARGGAVNQLTEEGQQDFYVRLAEARARPCPPPGPSTPQPPTEVTGTPPPTEPVPPPQREMTLEELQIEYAVACGDAEAAARERLLDALDRAISTEADPRRQAALARRRNQVAARTPTPCPTTTTPSTTEIAPPTTETPPPPPRPAPPLPGTSSSRTGLPWFPISTELAEDFRNRLNRAANFRLSGNCQAWAIEIAASRALVNLYVFATSDVRPPGTPPDFIGRELKEVARFYQRLLDQEAAQPCPPPPAPPPPPPPVQVVPDLRTGDAGPVQRDGGFRAVSVSVGYASPEIPTANYGFVSDGPPPEPEVPAARSVRRPGGFAIEASLDTGRLGEFTIGYAQADASNRAEIAAGPAGARRGYPHIDLSPSGSTGLSGNVPIDVDIEERVEAYRFGWSVHFGADPPAEALEDLRTRLNAEAGVTLSYRDRDHLGITSITTPVIATQRLEQEVTELEIGVFAGVEAVVPLSADVRLTLGVQAGLDYYDFDLRSVETNTQNFGPDADRAYTRSLKDSVGDIAYHGEAITELSVGLGPRFEMFARGRVRYSSDRAQVLNPVNGTFVQNGGTAGIGTDDAVDWGVSIGARIFWGSSRFR